MAVSIVISRKISFKFANALHASIVIFPYNKLEALQTDSGSSRSPVVDAIEMTTSTTQVDLPPPQEGNFRHRLKSLV